MHDASSTNDLNLELKNVCIFGSTWISNELGAGNPQSAHLTLSALMSITLSEMVIVSLSLFGGRNVFGFIFSNKVDVVEHVSSMAPLVCISVILDSLYGILSGWSPHHHIISLLPEKVGKSIY